MLPLLIGTSTGIIERKNNDRCYGEGGGEGGGRGGVWEGGGGRGGGEGEGGGGGGVVFLIRLIDTRSRKSYIFWP